MRILFLDDDDNRHKHFRQMHIGHDVTYVYTVEQCIEAMDKGPVFDAFSLDHDLGGQVYVTVEEGSGAQVARYISEMLPAEKYPQQIVVHSWNRDGAIRMVRLIKPTGIPVRWRKFEVAP